MEFSTFVRKNECGPGIELTAARHFCVGAESRFKGGGLPRFGIVEKTVEKLFWSGGYFSEQNLNFTGVIDHPSNFDEQLIFSEPIWNSKLFCLRESWTEIND